ncbi:hypothetical protein Psch_02074 [Pelotomaculum schinkii]|uniref:Uncharacterized protein n=1 Tax=Pelotomaculum schinkii TaxID=78350 RepID=A0A4Y7RID4_9FIRM|nr:hypothetical protein Psch_02074 [Pelotomaculum schinkii]
MNIDMQLKEVGHKYSSSSNVSRKNTFMRVGVIDENIQFRLNYK